MESTLLPTRIKFSYSGCVEFCCTKRNKVIQGVFKIILIFKLYLAQEVVEILEKLVVTRRKGQ